MLDYLCLSFETIVSVHVCSQGHFLDVLVFVLDYQMLRMYPPTTVKYVRDDSLRRAGLLQYPSPKER